MDEIEAYWERGAGEHPAGAPPSATTTSAIYGWDLRRRAARGSAASLSAPTSRTPRTTLVKQVVQNATGRAALRVLAPGSARPGAAHAVRHGGWRWRARHAERRRGDGIETLIVMLGANNALGDDRRSSSVAGPSDELLRGARGQGQHYTVWQPEHFRQELARVVKQRPRLPRAARHPRCTVPHVTIAPIARGVGTKKQRLALLRDYARPWVTDARFDPDRDDAPHRVRRARRRRRDRPLQRRDRGGRPRRARGRAGLAAARRLRACSIALASRRYIEDPTRAAGVVDRVRAAPAAAGPRPGDRPRTSWRATARTAARRAGCSRSTASTRRPSCTGSWPRSSSAS